MPDLIGIVMPDLIGIVMPDLIGHLTLLQGKGLPVWAGNDIIGAGNDGGRIRGEIKR